MRKRSLLSSIAMICVLMLSVSSCGGSDDTDPVDDIVATDDTTDDTSDDTVGDTGDDDDEPRNYILSRTITSHATSTTVTIDYLYDAAGQLIQIESVGDTFDYEYEGGRLVRIVNNEDAPTFVAMEELSYDDQGRMIQTKYSNNVNSNVRYITHTYDDLDRVATTMIFPDQESYDSATFETRAVFTYVGTSRDIESYVQTYQDGVVINDTNHRYEYDQAHGHSYGKAVDAAYSLYFTCYTGGLKATDRAYFETYFQAGALPESRSRRFENTYDSNGVLVEQTYYNITPEGTETLWETTVFTYDTF